MQDGRHHRSAAVPSPGLGDRIMRKRDRSGSKERRPYEKPRIRRFALATDQVLAVEPGRTLAQPIPEGPPDGHHGSASRARP